MISMTRRAAILACVLYHMALGHSHAEGSNSIRIGNWSGGPSIQAQSRQFEGCAARSENSQGIAMSYAIDPQYRWRLVVSNPAWSFTPGYSLALVLRLDDRNYLRGRAIVSGTQTLEIRTDDELSLFSGLWSANRLQVTAGGTKFEFELFDSNEVLSALLQCVVRQSGWSARKNAPPMPIRLDSETRAETRAIANEILAYSRIGQVQMSTASAVSSSQHGATSWKSGLINSALDVLEPKGIARLADVPLRLLDQEIRKCRNRFYFAWRLEQVDRLEIARVFTVCPAPELTTFAYYLAVSRSKGGYYLLSSTTSGGGFGGVVQQQLEEMDAKLRRSFNMAVNTFEQAQPKNRPESEVTADKPEFPAPPGRN